MIKSFVYGGKEGKEAAALCAKELKKSKDFVTRRFAVTALRTLQHEAAPFLDAYVAALRDDDAGVRYHAAMAFGSLGQAAAPQASSLAEALRDQDPGVRLWVAEALGGLGPRAADHAGALEKALGDADPHVRVAATRALVQVEPLAAPRAAAAHAAVLRDQEGEVCLRVSAADALGVLGASALPHTSAVGKALEDAFSGLRAAAARTLRCLGPGAVQGAALPLARLARLDPSEEVRAEASQALRQVDPSAALEHEDAAMRHWAASSLAGTSAGAAAPHAQVLASLLQDPDSAIRCSAAVALRGAGEAAASHAAALLTALRDPDPQVGVAAMRALVDTSPGSVPEAAACLEEGLRAPDPARRAGAAKALAFAEPATLRPHAEALAQALDDAEGTVREAAARALEVAGRQPVRDAGARLGALAKQDPDIDVRRAAVAALREHRLDIKFGVPPDPM